MFYEAAVYLILVLVGIVVGKVLIPYLRKLKFGQTIREEGPESHKLKTGTPTMGGIIFFFLFLFGGLIFGGFVKNIWFMIIFALAFGLVGFVDDYLIILRQKNLGLTARSKLFMLSICSILGTYYYINVMGYPTWIGLSKFNIYFELGNWYYLFALILIVGTTNAVNITDGVDGLCSSVTIIASLFFVIYSYVNDLHSILLFSIFLVASCTAILFYNWNPAIIFMGDTGSLFLGGALSILAMVTKNEILLPLIGGVYVLETLSVMAQVFSFKVFKKRIFKMSPIHHHFELSGWQEKKIVFVFSGIGFIFLIFSLILI